MFTIVTIDKWPNGKWHIHEIETTTKATFDRIVEAVHRSRFRNAAYLINENGKLIDSYAK